MKVPGSIQDLRSTKFYNALAAEFLGTFFLVFIGCGTCHSYEGNAVGIALGFGLAVGTMAWCIGHVSGCHINTAVTVGFLVTRKISLLRALLYMAVQVGGSIVGAAMLKLLTPINHPIHAALCTSTPGEGMTGGMVFGIELLITFVLVFTVFATCDRLRDDHGGSGALAIGLSLTFVHLFAVPLTGSGMNPARVFGPALMSNSWASHWPARNAIRRKIQQNEPLMAPAYWAGPCAGGAAAAILYDCLFAINASPSKLKGCFSCAYDDSEYGKEDTPESLKEDVLPLKEQP